MTWDRENFLDADHRYPRYQPLGRAPHMPPRLIDAYKVQDEGEFTLLELFVERCWHSVGLENWQPYQPRGWTVDGDALADFYLSEDGQELIGSFLHPPPNTPVTRFALLFHASEIPARLITDTGKIIKVPEGTPLPERLRRLIWIEW